MKSTPRIIRPNVANTDSDNEKSEYCEATTSHE